MDFIGVFSSIYKSKEEKHAFGELNYELNHLLILQRKHPVLGV